MIAGIQGDSTLTGFYPSRNCFADETTPIAVATNKYDQRFADVGWRKAVYGQAIQSVAWQSIQPYQYCQAEG